MHTEQKIQQYAAHNTHTICTQLAHTQTHTENSTQNRTQNSTEQHTCTHFIHIYSFDFIV